MAAQRGREVLIKVDISGTLTVLGGMRTKSLTINSEMVDISDSDSASQWRELLGGAGIKTMQIQGQGVFKDSAAEAQAVALALSGDLEGFSFYCPGLGTFSCECQVTSLEVSGEYNGQVNYNMTFESAGAVTFVGA